jgi:hypothetical protein
MKVTGKSGAKRSESEESSVDCATLETLYLVK